MGQVKKHPPVKLIAGLIFKDKLSLDRARAALKRRFGEIDFESQVLAFNLTDYYKKEFGEDLKKSFVSFKKLVDPARLTSIKIATNKIEKRLSKGPRRLVNIDPGYLDLAKLILASTKDYIHRIYLGRGIFAEMTLYYEGDSFVPWKWTYPDYRTPAYIEIFNRIRELYLTQIKDTQKSKIPIIPNPK